MARSETDVEDPDDDLAYAIGRYVLGGISLGGAAELAGVSRWRMMELLREHDIEIRLGPESIDEARAEAEGQLGEFLAADADE
jgi:predicted HTH domain antitoxin